MRFGLTTLPNAQGRGGFDSVVRNPFGGGLTLPGGLPRPRRMIAGARHFEHSVDRRTRR
ncbi:hypothetical protein AB0H00_25290 [Nocardia sp. NPDC023852]|uniref:hypothetical protein n=1 Tax=Nocardia sp. NPDC023852 TaxID=3154697 RepID=UPI0033E4881A